MADAFQPGAFQESPAFQMGSEAALPASANPQRIPRWLLKFERVGRIIYLSDVGGEVEGQFYIPAIDSVSHSELLIDLERMSIPEAACTVSVSPSSLREHFIEPNELGQAKVTVSSWDGHTARPIIQADMEELGFGFDGELTTFRLSEKFRYNPIFPEKLVNYGTDQGFTKAELDSGARFRDYTQVWGDAQGVVAFDLLTNAGNTRYMIAGHNVPNLPTGGDGSPARYQDLTGATYIGVEFSSPPNDITYDFEESWGVENAAQLIRQLIHNHSTYPTTELDHAQLQRLFSYLKKFPAAGYVDQEGPLFDLFTKRFQREWLFVVYQQAGLLRGTPIDPTAPPAKVLVLHVHLLQLADQVFEDRRYTRFKVRYQYRAQGADGQGWYGVKDLGPWNSAYLKSAMQKWGDREFGDPVEWKRHTSSVDLADTEVDGAAVNLLRHYAHIFHRGERPKYLELAESADTPLGTMIALVDPPRGYDQKRALLIGRQWQTPELLVHTYRTIERFKIEAKPGVGAAEGGGGGGSGCPDIFVNGFTDDSWTKTIDGSGTSVSANAIAVDRHPSNSGFWGVSVTKHIDSANWGSATELNISFNYEVTLDSVAGVPQATISFSRPAVIFEIDQTGVVGSQTGSYGVTLLAPFSGDLTFTIWLNGTCTGHAAITAVVFDLQPCTPGPFDCWDVPAPGMVDPTGGPDGQPAVLVHSDAFDLTLSPHCPCGVNTLTDGWIRYGARLWSCVGAPGSTNFGFVATVKRYSDPDCLTLIGTYVLTSLDSGGGDNVAHDMDHYVHQPVSAGEHITIDVELVNTGPALIDMRLIAIYLEFFSVEPSDRNVDTTLGPCTP